MGDYDSILIPLIGIAFALGVLYLIREVVLWYFKINVRVEQNDQIIKLLTKIASRLPEQDEFMK